jgi:hypothetical protein
MGRRPRLPSETGYYHVVTRKSVPGNPYREIRTGNPYREIREIRTGYQRDTLTDETPDAPSEDLRTRNVEFVLPLL